MDDYLNNEPEKFWKFWNSSFYSLGDWVIENLVAIYDTDFNLIHGEHHETLSDGSKARIELPDILQSKDEKSKKFIQKLYDENGVENSYPVDFVMSRNNHPILVYVGEIRYEHNDTVGYLLIGTDFAGFFENLVHGK